MRALLTPELNFTTLSDATVRCDEQGLPIVHRTTRYMECEIERQGVRYLLSIALSTATAHRDERLMTALRHRHHPLLNSLQLLRNELRIEGESVPCDVLLQEIVGRPLREAIPLFTAEELAAAIDHLKEELRSAGITHRNLKLTNLRWFEGRLIPVRYYDAVLNAGGEEDAAALDRLYEELAAMTGSSLADEELKHTCLHCKELLTGHRWVGNEFEGLTCVEDATGFGFVDTANRMVIPARYRWADDFHEGRAVVETESGMGLINREGHYILPPLYEIVDYRYERSLIQARQAGLWAQFDYLGRQLTPFGTSYEV